MSLRQGMLPSNIFKGDTYCSPKRKIGEFAQTLPSVAGYIDFAAAAIKLYIQAAAGRCTDDVWMKASEEIIQLFERVGCTFHIEGMDNIDIAEGPCVFASNHMSTLETFVFPAIIRPHGPVTFVVKDSLTTVPLFSTIMNTRAPIAVGRTNPRADLTKVLSEGVNRIQNNISVIIFPQSTRSTVFVPHKFNSIAVKLAKRANVPLIPVALKTDAWSQGKLCKDFGKIYPQREIHIRFGKPILVQNQGREEHEEVCRFIESSLEGWAR